MLLCTHKYNIHKNNLFQCVNVFLYKHTHSMPSINGVSGQSFSGKRCTILPHDMCMLPAAVPRIYQPQIVNRLWALKFIFKSQIKNSG